MRKTISIVLVLVLSLVVEVVNADFTFGIPENLGPTINSGSADLGPSISADGLSLFFSSRRGGGFGAEDIYVATRATKCDPWEEPMNLGATVNSPNWEQVPSISADGLSLFFSSDRLGGVGPESLWVTTRETKDDPWGTPINLGPTVNSLANDWMPSIAADGLSLYFSSKRSGGYGRWDLWATIRETIHDEWGPPVNLGSTVNSGDRELSMSISHDGLLLFFGSDRPGGSSGHDLWVTRRAAPSDPWETPVNLGPTVNSSALYDQTPSISADGSTLYLSSNRPDGIGDIDIYKASIDPIVDLNADGMVDALDRGIMMDHWGEDYPLCDIGPMPWGDGIVDMQDLLVLTEYLEPIDTLIAHWALDETEGITAHDSVSGNDDIIMGDPLWQPTGGKVDGALELDGMTNCIITSTGPNPAEGPFSIFVWIKDGAPGQVIISQPLGSNWLVVDADGTLMTELKASGNDLSTLPSQSILTDEQWHHIGLVWDGSQRMLCADGIVVAEDTLDGLEASAGALYIGVGNNYTAGSFFSGLIDDVRIYCRALSAEDIGVLAQ